MTTARARVVILIILLVLILLLQNTVEREVVREELRQERNVLKDLILIVTTDITFMKKYFHPHLSGSLAVNIEPIRADQMLLIEDGVIRTEEVEVLKLKNESD